MLGSLLGIHTYLLVNNLSTLEMDQLSDGNSFMNKKRKTLSTAERKSHSKSLQLMFGVKVVQNQNEVGGGSQRYKMVNDYYKNWTDSFGSNYCWWLVPISAED